MAVWAPSVCLYVIPHNYIKSIEEGYSVFVMSFRHRGVAMNMRGKGQRSRSRGENMWAWFAFS